jgi:L-asparaginase
MLRFSAPGRYSTLADAVTAVAGPGGELQRSAGQRWNITGEGEGGIIGIEADSASTTGILSGQLRRGRVVFDFNSGGMWRAYIEEDSDGKDKEVIMVFREEYQ